MATYRETIRDEYEYGRIYDPGIAPVRGKREE